MGAYILRRLLLVIPTLFGVMVINFALTQFVPGGPIEQIHTQPYGSRADRLQARAASPAGARRRLIGAGLARLAHFTNTPRGP